MNKTKPVKFPVDILNELQREYPQFNNPVRIRMMYIGYMEHKELKAKLTKMGQVVWGKSAWNERFKTK